MRLFALCAPHTSNLMWRGARVVEIDSTAGPKVAKSYGPSGALDTMSVAGSVTRFDRVSGMDLVTMLGDNLVLRQHWGSTGKLMRQAIAAYDGQAPLDGVGLDADPALVEWVRYEYDSSERLRSEHWKDNRSVEYEHNADGCVVRRWTRQDGKVLHDERYRYDPVGMPLMAGAQYDALFRPSSFHGEVFEYDAAGRLASRLTDEGRWEYKWDSASNLTEVVTPRRRVVMAYDARRRRVGKKVFDGTTLVSDKTYVWARNVVLHEVDNVAGATRTYLRRDETWAPFGHVETHDDRVDTTFYLSNPAGLPERGFDAQGRVVWAGEYSLFGDCTETVRDHVVDVRFANQHYDEDIELSYNYHRWYEPRLGVYLSPDLAFLDGSPGPRDFVPNPLDFIDPLGEARQQRQTTNHHTGNPNRPQPRAHGHEPRPQRPRARHFDGRGEYLLRPGHWATKGRPGGPPGYAIAEGNLQTQQGNWPRGIADMVDAAGDEYGCHSCGARENLDENGNPVAHWTPDHQPQVSQVRQAAGDVAEVRLYPHCRGCSNAQRTQASSYRSGAKGQSTSLADRSAQRGRRAERAGATQSRHNRGKRRDQHIP